MKIKHKQLSSLLILVLSFNVTTLFSQKTTVPVYKEVKKTYKYRKHGHVKKMYQRLAEPVTELCVQYKIPPAAVLSIISLESGWGNGYIGLITGNFMSLNASSRRNDPQLPALRMPQNKKTGKVIIKTSVLNKTPKENIIWKNRPSSLKKDYRPKGIAETKENLDYFLLHPEELTKANLENVKDFATKFIAYTSGIRAYRQAREMLDLEIEKHGISILFDEELNRKFIYTIGGRPSSFNTRATWPKKVNNILKHVGAVALTKDLYLNKTPFNQAW